MPRRVAIAILALLGVCLVAARVVEITTEAVNWDEFALFDRVARSLASGTMQTGGRPGLGVLALMPVVSGCTDPIATATTARWLWLLPTLGSLVGLFVLVRRLASSFDAALAVGLLALVPVFHRWSVQVRTDQLAVLGGVWGAVALVGSRRRIWLAAVAGVAFAFGYLASQKALYLAGLGGMLALGDHLLARAWPSRRELVRGALAAVTFVACVVAFQRVVGALFVASTGTSASSELAQFPWYRKIIGFRVYEGMISQLAVHILLGALLAVTTIRARGDDRRRLAVSWLVLACGVGVGWFHAAAFPYFWMTLGVFPAVALAVAAPAIRQLFTQRMRPLFMVGIWLALLAVAVPGFLSSLRDTQAVQRRSLAFVDRAFAVTDRGFQLDGALFCRKDEDPLPIYLRVHVEREFLGPDAAKNIAWLQDEFRRRPIKFIVGSHRIFAFPGKMRDFWFSHYLPYRGTVLVPGRALRGASGDRGEIDLVAAGTYRWRSDVPGGRVTFDGSELADGATVAAGAGKHSVAFATDGAGVLVLDLDEPPEPESIQQFFSPIQLSEILGHF